MHAGDKMAKTVRPKKSGDKAPIERIVDVDIKSTDENWSTYKLGDGTVIRARPVIVEAKRREGEYNAQGDPIYNLEIAVVVSAKVPKKLKQKVN